MMKYILFTDNDQYVMKCPDVHHRMEGVKAYLLIFLNTYYSYNGELFLHKGWTRECLISVGFLYNHINFCQSYNMTSICILKLNPFHYINSFSLEMKRLYVNYTLYLIFRSTEE